MGGVVALACRVGRNSMVVWKKVQDSQIDSKWQSRLNGPGAVAVAEHSPVHLAAEFGHLGAFGVGGQLSWRVVEGIAAHGHRPVQPSGARRRTPPRRRRGSNDRRADRHPNGRPRRGEPGERGAKMGAEPLPEQTPNGAEERRTALIMDLWGLSAVVLRGKGASEVTTCVSARVCAAGRQVPRMV